MLTQVYEVSEPAEGTAISSIGIDHVGVLVGEGEFPREQTMEAAERIAAAIEFLALFLTKNISLIEMWVRKLRPHIVHPPGAAADLLLPPQVARAGRRVSDADEPRGSHECQVGRLYGGDQQHDGRTNGSPVTLLADKGVTPSRPSSPCARRGLARAPQLRHAF